MPNPSDDVRNAYLAMILSTPSTRDDAEFLLSQVAEQLTELSDILFKIQKNAYAVFDIAKGNEAGRYRDRVVFMKLHVNQQLIDLIDSSPEITAIQQTIEIVNKQLAKVKSDSENLAKELSRIAGILGEFETLVGWIKTH